MTPLSMQQVDAIRREARTPGLFSNFVFHHFQYKKRSGKNYTIVGHIPTIDFTFLVIFYSVKTAF